MKVKSRSLSPGLWQLEGDPLPSSPFSLSTVKGFTVNLWNIRVLTNTIQTNSEQQNLLILF